MNEGCRETICARCNHRDVCSYKNIYLAYVENLSKFHSDYFDDISFIKWSEPVCKFYAKKPEINLRDDVRL